MANFHANQTGVRAGGRTKGTPNRATLLFLARIEELQTAGLACDPVRVLMEIAIGKEFNEEDGTLREMVPKPRPQDRAQCASELCSYMYPKRKAIEVTGNEGSPINFVIAQDTSELPQLEDTEFSTSEAEPLTLIGEVTNG